MTGQLPMFYSADLSQCAAISQLTKDEILEMFTLVMRSAGATIVDSHSYDHAGAGLTCTLFLSESHAVLRTRPHNEIVNVDIFSCSSSLNSLDAIDNLRRLFGARNACIQEVPRADGEPSRPQHSKLLSWRA